MTKLMKLASVCLILGAGCGTDEAMEDGPELLPNLMLPAKPSNGLQVVTPIVRGLEPGSDHEICTWTDAIAPAVLDVKSTEGYQTEPGHHIVVYYTTEKQPAGTSRECTDTDMVTFRIVTGNGKEGEPSEAPGNLVFRIPEGAQIVINHHYLNATDETLDGQSAVNINFAEPGGTYTPSGSAAFLNSGLVVKPGDTSQHQHCVAQRDLKLWFLNPHMHQWGKHIKVDLMHDDTATNLFDTEWDPSYAFHPPQTTLDPSAPMMMHKGDAIDTTCEWMNDTGHDLAFGFEMCVFYAQFIDENGDGGWSCDGDSWNPL